VYLKGVREVPFLAGTEKAISQRPGKARRTFRKGTRCKGFSRPPRSTGTTVSGGGKKKKGSDRDGKAPSSEKKASA